MENKMCYIYVTSDIHGCLIWMQNLPRYHVEGNTIFVHAGIDEEAEDLWEWETDDYE